MEVDDYFGGLLADHREQVGEDVGVEISPHAHVHARDVPDLVRVRQNLLGLGVPEQHLPDRKKSTATTDTLTITYVTRIFKATIKQQRQRRQRY